MRHFTLATLLLATSLSAVAHQVGPYFGLTLGLSDVGTTSRKLRSDATFGGGRVTFSGKNLKIRGNSLAGNNNFNNDVSLKLGDQRAQGYAVSLGYQMIEGFAFEYRYNKFGDAEYQDTQGNKAFNKMYSMDVVGLGSYAFAQNWDLRGALGVTWLHSSLSVDGALQSPPNGFGATFAVAAGIADNSEDVVSGLLSAGVAYHWNEHTDIVFDHVVYHGQQGLDNASMTQIGLSYYFNG